MQERGGKAIEVLWRHREKERGKEITRDKDGGNINVSDVQNNFSMQESEGKRQRQREKERDS